MTDYRANPLILRLGNAILKRLIQQEKARVERERRSKRLNAKKSRNSPCVNEGVEREEGPSARRRLELFEDRRPCRDE
jgi:hypothetical protein